MRGRVCVCAVIAFTPQATYVGPGEIESKLEAINLTFAVPSDLVWSRIHIQCRCSISTDAASICDPISVTGTASDAESSFRNDGYCCRHPCGADYSPSM